MGIAVEEHYDKDGKYQGCRVFVGNSPDLLVLEDTDGDDKADKRYPLLTGFGGIDSDHGVHGMVLGLDGKLYFTHGDGCCSVQQDHSERPQNFDVVDKSGRHVSTDQLANTLRVNRDGTQFEIICDRQRNNYETSLNAFGNIFTSDNDDDGNRGCRVIWAMDGGHYGYRTPGSPRHWGEEVPGNVPKLVGTGNGSPCGIMVYEGELLPAGISRGRPRGRRRHAPGQLLPARPARGPRSAPSTRSSCPATTRGSGRSMPARPRWLGVRGRLVRRGRRRPCLQRPDDRADLSRRAQGAQEPEGQGRLRDARRADRRAQVAEHRHPGCGPAGLDRAGQSSRTWRSTLGDVAVQDPDPIYRARALWVWHAIEGDAVAMAALTPRGQPSGDPRIREQAVRMLGRDCRENGHVEYQKPEAKQPPAALEHLDVLLALADDPDAGVRRELILALRNLPTDKVGDALRKLAASWDGQDRWYLEALGLALDKRESSFLGQALRRLALSVTSTSSAAGQDGKVALPPYFPVDRNEAYIATGTPDLPATALSKYLGLAWRIHRREVLPLLKRVAPHLRAPELQQAADDILEQMKSRRHGRACGRSGVTDSRPGSQARVVFTLARRLAAEWRSARYDPIVRQLIDSRSRTPKPGCRVSRWRPRPETRTIARCSRPSPCAPTFQKKPGSRPWRRSEHFPTRPIACSIS